MRQHATATGAPCCKGTAHSHTHSCFTEESATRSKELRTSLTDTDKRVNRVAAASAAHVG